MGNGRMIATDLQSIQNITADKRVKDWTQMDNLGYAELKDCTNDDKPYLMIEAVDKDFTKYSPITLLEGKNAKGFFRDRDPPSIWNTMAA